MSESAPGRAKRTARSVCSRCGMPRENIEQPWYRVSAHGAGGNYVGDHLGVIIQWCEGCWHEATRRLGEESKAHD